MKRKLAYATGRMEAIKRIAQASHYIAHIDDLKPGPAVLYLRVSRRGQKANLPEQEARLKQELEKRGFTVISVFSEIVPGWAEPYERTKLEFAAWRAKSASVL